MIEHLGLTAAYAVEMPNTVSALKDKLVSYFTDPDLWMNVMLSVAYIIIIYLGSRLIVKIADKAITHMMIERERSPLKFDPRRTKTIGKLIRNIISYTVNFIAILLILSQIGLKLGPLLAGAGVIGLAIGFGAQSLVKDVITGFFIIFEDQFAVGDTIQTGNFKGTVEEIGLRITRIRNWTGEVHIIPNGSITQVTNFSVNNSIAVIDVSIAYEADIDAAIQVIRETVNKIAETNENIVKGPEVLGIQTLAASEVIIRVTSECKPNMQFAVAREMNAALKKALDAHGIEIPYPRLVTFQRTEKVQ